MNRLFASLIAVSGLTASAHGQLIKCLVSTDGTTFSNSVAASPGQTIQILVTASYTGTSTAIAGFGSANFQPTVSGWRTTDTLLPIREGSNTTPPDGSGTVRPQFYSGSSFGDGVHVSAGYVAGTYGRVTPMANTPLAGSNGLQGFVHVNPDGSGQTYLRIAQANNPGWIGTPGNTLGTGGVEVGQKYLTGRTTDDPDFWGNRETLFVDPTDPEFGWATSARIPANDVRRTNVELFRFAFTMDSTFWPRDMVIDVPYSGQQVDQSTGVRYVGYYNSLNGGISHLQAAVQTGVIHIVPAPAAFPVLGLWSLLAIRRTRRRAYAIEA